MPSMPWVVAPRQQVMLLQREASLNNHRSLGRDSQCLECFSLIPRGGKLPPVLPEIPNGQHGQRGNRSPEFTLLFVLCAVRKE